MKYVEWVLETVLDIVRKTLKDDGVFEKSGTIHVAIGENYISAFSFDKEGEKRVINVNKIHD